VQNGLTYYYVTTAVDSSGIESVYSNEVSAKNSVVAVKFLIVYGCWRECETPARDLGDKRQL